MKHLISIFILLNVLTAPTLNAQPNTEFQSLLKLQIHQKVQELRKNQKEIKAYILESHVRKVQMDYLIKFRKSGFTQDEIAEMFRSPEFQDLFERIRTNPALVGRTDQFLDDLMSPHHIENQVIQRHIEMVQTWQQLRMESQTQLLLDYQQKVRILEKDPQSPQGFWAKMRQMIQDRLFG